MPRFAHRSPEPCGLNGRSRTCRYDVHASSPLDIPPRRTPHHMDPFQRNDIPPASPRPPRLGPISTHTHTLSRISHFITLSLPWTPVSYISQPSHCMTTFRTVVEA